MSHRIRSSLAAGLALTLVLPTATAGARPVSESSRYQGLAHTSLAAEAPRGRLDTALDELVGARARGGAGMVAAEARSSRIELSVNGATVAIYAQPGQSRAVAKAVTDSAGRVSGVADDLIMAEVPVERLVALSLHPAVRSVFAPPKPQALEVTSESLPEINAAALTAETSDHPAYTGASIRIGVIDEGYTDYQGLLGTELPSASKVHLWPSDKSTEDIYDSNHGTAVLEVIHDIAPNAELYIAAVDDPTDIAESVDWMLANKVHVINMSMAWWGWARVDGGGPVNTPFDKAAGKGVTCVVSGGNYRRRHWHGDFNPGPEAGTRQFLHNWSPNNEENRFVVKNGGWVEAWLWWDDWTAPSQDFNLQLVRLDGTAWVEVAQSRDLQSATQRPVEWIGMTLPPGTYAWRIWKHSASRNDVNFDFFVPRGIQFDPGDPNQASTFTRSLLQPADNRSPGVVSVAAIGHAQGGYAQEDYSSEGPTIDGRGGLDISAPTVVSTSVKGPGGFNGTSGSAPHVAGIAALMHQSEQGITGPEVEQSLTGQTVDLGAPGVDRIFGAGRVSLKTLPSLTASASASLVGYQQPTTASGHLRWGAMAFPNLTTVSVWQRAGASGAWVHLGPAVWNDGLGAYIASVPFSENGAFQLRFPGSSQFAPRRSAPVSVRARAFLSTPSAPSSVRRGKAFTVTGLLRPKHSGGTRLELYKYKGTKPVLQRRYTPKITSIDASTSRYSASLVAPTSGAWLVKATHSDTSHAPTVSGGRRFSVR